MTYAKLNATRTDVVPGVGNGYLDVYDTSGNLLSRFASNAPLNAPWGVALAPASFGQYGGDLLVANHGDGTIATFDPEFRGVSGTDGELVKPDPDDRRTARASVRQRRISRFDRDALFHERTGRRDARPVRQPRRQSLHRPRLRAKHRSDHRCDGHGRDHEHLDR